MTNLVVRDPADVRAVVGEVPAMTPGEAAAAYQRARAGFETWRRASPLDRATVLAAAADLIRSGAQDGAVTLVRENGRTLAEAQARSEGADVITGGGKPAGEALFKEQGAPGLRFYTRIKTAAVRYAW